MQPTDEYLELSWRVIARFYERRVICKQISPNCRWNTITFNKIGETGTDDDMDGLHN